MSTVEEIVTDIQNGADRKNELYADIYKYLYLLCKRYLTFASELGYEIDDLVSASWFGVERAIKDFDPGKGYKFITYLKYHVNNAVREFLGIRNGRATQYHTSLDEEVPGTDGRLTYLDTIEDETTAEVFEEAENVDYFNALLEEVGKLPPIQSDTIKRHFLSSETLDNIARSRNVSRESVRQHERNALRALQRNKRLRECYREDFAYKHVGVRSFNNTWTSSTEWAALRTMAIAEQIEELRGLQED